MGSLQESFSEVFPELRFFMDFWQFSMKKQKKQKSPNMRLDTRRAVFREVRQVPKKACRSEKNAMKKHFNFSRKIDPRSSGKNEPNRACYKNRLKNATGATLGAPASILGRFCGSSGRSRGAPGTPQDATKTLPRSLPDTLGHHGASREGPGSDFESILGAPRPIPGAILARLFAILA